MLTLALQFSSQSTYLLLQAFTLALDNVLVPLQNLALGSLVAVPNDDQNQVSYNLKIFLLHLK